MSKKWLFAAVGIAVAYYLVKSGSNGTVDPLTKAPVNLAIGGAVGYFAASLF